MKKNKLVVIVSAIVIIVTGSILLGYKVGKSNSNYNKIDDNTKVDDSLVQKLNSYMADVMYFSCIRKESCEFYQSDISDNDMIMMAIAHLKPEKVELEVPSDYIEKYLFNEFYYNKENPRTWEAYPVNKVVEETELMFGKKAKENIKVTFDNNFYLSSNSCDYILVNDYYICSASARGGIAIGDRKKVVKSLKEDNIVTIVSKASYITMDDEVFDLQVTEKFQENINGDYIWVYSKTEKI